MIGYLSWIPIDEKYDLPCEGIKTISWEFLIIQSASYPHPSPQFFGNFVLYQPAWQYFLKAAVAVSNTLQIFPFEKCIQEQNKDSLWRSKSISQESYLPWKAWICFAVIISFQGQRVCTKRYNLLSNITKSAKCNYSFISKTWYSSNNFWK